MFENEIAEDEEEEDKDSEEVFTVLSLLQASKQKENNKDNHCFIK
jgi:hypothetical protein